MSGTIIFKWGFSASIIGKHIRGFIFKSIYEIGHRNIRCVEMDLKVMTGNILDIREGEEVVNTLLTYIN